MGRGHLSAAISSAMLLAMCASAPVGPTSQFAAGGVELLDAADIVVESKALYLGHGEVRVRYAFRSATGQPQRARLGFRLPAVPIFADDPNYLGGGPGGTEPRNYLEFEVTADGRPVQKSLREHAWLDGEDVAPLLDAHGIPAFLPLEEAKRLAGLAPEALAELERHGIVHYYENLPDYVVPLWNYQLVYEWRQDFSANRTVVEIAYRPIIGYVNDIFEVDGPEVDGYCVDDALRAGVRRRLATQNFEPTTLGYMPAGRDGLPGPIGEFSLTVSKAIQGFSPSDVLVAFCPLESRKISDTEFRWTARDYMPEGEIKVLFLEFFDRRR